VKYYLNTETLKVWNSERTPGPLVSKALESTNLEITEHYYDYLRRGFPDCGLRRPKLGDEYYTFDYDSDISVRDTWAFFHADDLGDFDRGYRWCSVFKCYDLVNVCGRYLVDNVDFDTNFGGRMPLYECFSAVGFAGIEYPSGWSMTLKDEVPTRIRIRKSKDN
jgi:hypothetical protein